MLENYQNEKNMNPQALWLHKILRPVPSVFHSRTKNHAFGPDSNAIGKVSKARISL